MVASDECYSIGVSYFEAEKEEERFERVEAAVNEVACLKVSVRLAFSLGTMRTYP